MILRRTTPGKAGIAPAAISAFLNGLSETNAGAHSFMLIRHGEVACEGWWKPYAPEKTHMLFSLSKSFTSTAAGFAVQEGLLSLEDKVLSFFEGELPSLPCENMQKMTVRDLLTMNTGHDVEPRAFDEKIPWTTLFLSSYIPRTPGTKFTYNTPATYMVSAILQKVTGRKLIDYLKPRLFEPLGITGMFWEESPQGVNTGGFGLNIKTEDIARFGQFLLNKGMVDGKQLIDPEWISQATARQVPNGNPADDNDWAQGYGYQFWRCKPKNVYRGDGAFGQLCVVMPDQDAVVAMTSGSGDIGNLLNHIWKYLLPAMRDTQVPDDGLDELKEQLSHLGIALPRGDARSDLEKTAGGVYALPENRARLKSFGVDFTKADPIATVCVGEDTFAFPCGFGRYIESGEGENHRAAAYAWLPDGRLQIDLINDLTPFIQTVRAAFDGRYVSLEIRQNVGFEDVNCDIIGKKEA